MYRWLCMEMPRGWEQAVDGVTDEEIQARPTAHQGTHLFTGNKKCNQKLRKRSHSKYDTGLNGTGLSPAVHP